MINSITLFHEPELEFRYGQKVIDPRMGLTLFGPYDTDEPSHPPSIPYVVIGTSDGISDFSTWSEIMNNPAMETPDNNYKLWPPYPGFEAAFHSEWSIKPIWSYEIDKSQLIHVSHTREPHERAFKVVEYYMEGLRKAKKLDENIAVAICIVPEEVWLHCRPKSRINEPIGNMISKKGINMRMAGQLEFFEDYDPEQYRLSIDFRRQLKARAMEYGIPLQIIIQSTLRPNNIIKKGERGLTPLSDRMWNLGTALYYKAGGKPWRLVTARDGVCYIGIAFRRVEQADITPTACCAAQMFLNTGDGVVFLSDEQPFYSHDADEFHLTKSSAKNLLTGVLKTYSDLGGKELTEIFLHSRSTISGAEFEGYEAACPSDVKIVGVRAQVDKKAPRLFRVGKMPIARGTFWKLNEQSGLLWGNGFKPSIETYDGWEVPVPLRIDIQHGQASIERVAQDIFGLTKLNYNSSHLGNAEPVTIGFSDAVGEILISNPAIAHHRPNFKFYI